MHFVKENKLPLLVLILVTGIFAAFLYTTFVIKHPNMFLTSLDSDIMVAKAPLEEKSMLWRPVPLTKNFFSLFTYGVSLSLVAPDIAKIASHPSLQPRLAPIWPAFGIALLLANAIVLWMYAQQTTKQERAFLLFLGISIFITIMMVILARPDHSPIPDFDYRYAGPPYYFYCIFFALLVTFLRKRDKEFWTKIIVSIVVVIFASQQAFSFQKARLKTESDERKAAIVHLGITLIPEFERLSEENTHLIIPNLTGAHIFQGMPGYTLADYLPFFGRKFPIQLIQNSVMPPDVKTHTVVTVPSLRASTSPEFIEALKSSPTLQEFYTSPALMQFRVLPEDTEIAHREPQTHGDILVDSGPFDPEKRPALDLSFSTLDIPGNLEIALSFQNDFGRTGPLAEVRVDDFMSFVKRDGKRFYHLELPLLEIYPYALSRKVSNVTLSVPAEKETAVYSAYLK